MAKGPNETTDKLFPVPPLSGEPAQPIPLLPSIREEFVAHRLHMDKQAVETRAAVQGILARLPAAPVHPQSVLGAVKGGVIKAGKVTPLILIIGEAIASVASELGHTTWVGPIRFILGLFG